MNSERNAYISTIQYGSTSRATWVGPGPGPYTVCTAVDGGRLQIVNNKRLERGGQLLTLEDVANQGALEGPALAPGREAEVPLVGSRTINAAAFIRNRVVVSTRDRVQVMQEDDLTKITHETNFGAHGIATNGFDSLAAPAGVDGLFCMRLFNGTMYRHALISDPSSDVYFYRTALLGRDGSGTDWFASACRDAGALVTPIRKSPENISFDLYKGPTLDGRAMPFDVVDVCPLNLRRHPFGAIFLTGSGHAHFSFDIRQGIVTFQRLDLGDETPYSIHSAQGHLFIATDDGVHIFQNLTRFVVSPHLHAQQNFHYFMPLDVVWSNVIGDYLYVVTGSSVLICDIGHFDSEINLASKDVGEPSAHESTHIKLLGSYPSRIEKGVYRPSGRSTEFRTTAFA